MDNKTLDTDKMLDTDIERKSGNKDFSESIYKPLTYEKQLPTTAENYNGNRETFFLYFCALTADLVMFACGCSLVWSSPAIPKLKSHNPEINPLGIPITELEESWIASLPPLGATIGPLLIGKLADSYGRRTSLIILAVLKITSYVTLAFATSIYVYYVTRLLIGIGVGMGFAFLPSYIGEICDDHNRGKFGCTMGIFAALGVMYAIAVGPILSIKMFTLSCTVPLIYLFICFLFILPETPVYLASVGKRKQARKVLMRLRNKDQAAAEKDLLEIIEIIDKSSKSKSSYAGIFKTSVLRKGLLICAGLCCLQQFSGINPILAFIEPIFNLAGGGMSANLSSILVAIVQVLGTTLASVVVERVGRKCLLLVSTINCALSLITLGLYFYLKHIEFIYIKNIFWLPVTSIIAYLIFFNLGLGPVPWALASEIFPSNVKATANSLVTVIGAFTAFSVTFLFPHVIKFLGAANCFWTFGGFCILGAVIIYIEVPETKGKNIVEIQRILSKSGKETFSHN